MIRYDCDICMHEVEAPAEEREFKTWVKPDEPREPTTERKVEIRLRRAIDGTWNAGHICDRCLGTALRQIGKDLKEAR